MKKRVLMVLLAGTVAMSMMAGCGKSAEKTENKEAAEELTDGSDEPEEIDEEELLEVDEEAADETAEEAPEEEDDLAGTEVSEEEVEGSSVEKAIEVNTADSTEAKGAQVLDVSEPLTGIHHATLEIQDYGTIELELDADTAPISVTNFVKLAQEGFYDGLTFHRIISGFMMQGGDPLGNGTGGSEENIKGEFEANGVKNDISHKRGVISMARAMDPDSGSSQFFIMHKDYPSLDGQYAAFGHVTSGIEVVDKICEEAKPTDSNGSIAPEDQPIITSLVIND